MASTIQQQNSTTTAHNQQRDIQITCVAGRRIFAMSEMMSDIWESVVAMDRSHSFCWGEAAVRRGLRGRGGIHGFQLIQREAR